MLGRFFDFIIGMDSMNIRNLFRMAPSMFQHKISMLLSFVGLSKDIADPWYSGNFEETYQDVRCGCEALLKNL